MSDIYNGAFLQKLLKAESSYLFFQKHFIRDVWQCSKYGSNFSRSTQDIELSIK